MLLRKSRRSENIENQKAEKKKKKNRSTCPHTKAKWKSKIDERRNVFTAKSRAPRSGDNLPESHSWNGVNGERKWRRKKWKKEAWNVWRKWRRKTPHHHINRNNHDTHLASKKRRNNQSLRHNRNKENSSIDNEENEAVSKYFGIIGHGGENEEMKATTISHQAAYWNENEENHPTENQKKIINEKRRRSYTKMK